MNRRRPEQRRPLRELAEVQTLVLAFQRPKHARGAGDHLDSASARVLCTRCHGPSIFRDSERTGSACGRSIDSRPEHASRCCAGAVRERRGMAVAGVGWSGSRGRDGEDVAHAEALAATPRPTRASTRSARAALNERRDSLPAARRRAAADKPRQGRLRTDLRRDAVTTLRETHRHLHQCTRTVGHAHDRHRNGSRTTDLRQPRQPDGRGRRHARRQMCIRDRNRRP